LQNKLPNQQDLVNVIAEAVYSGNGKGIDVAVQKINEEFILIKKSDLPEVTGKPHPWRENKETPMARTAGYNGRSAKLYWNRALDFISISLYAEEQEADQAKRELTWKREEAFKMLYPNSCTVVDYETADLSVKVKIDVVVGLMAQVDELKASK
jgi:hypothetical protein